jgi:hypothetical protein
MIGAIANWLGSFGFLRALVGLVGSTFKYLTKVIGDFIEQSPTLQAVFGVIADAVGVMSDALSFAWEIIKAVASALATLGKAHAEFWSDRADDLTKGMIEAKSQIDIASSVPIAAQSSAAISNSRTSNKTTSVQIGEVKVQTQATDAAGISKSIGGAMQSQMRQAASNFDDGVLA